MHLIFRRSLLIICCSSDELQYLREEVGGAWRDRGWVCRALNSLWGHNGRYKATRNYMSVNAEREGEREGQRESRFCLEARKQLISSKLIPQEQLFSLLLHYDQTDVFVMCGSFWLS